MPQVIEFPAMAGDAATVLSSLARVCRELPEAGMSFRDLRARLRSAKLWDKERPAVVLRILGVGGAQVVPSTFVKKLAAARSEDEILVAIAERYLEANPLLFKTVFEMLEQRAHGKDEIYKILGSFAYRGKVPSRPDAESYFAALVATGVARPVGIALGMGPRGEHFSKIVSALDVDELLEEDKPWPEPVIPSADDDAAAAPAEIEPEASVPGAAAAAPPPAPVPAGQPLPAYLRHLAGAADVASPRNREKPVPVVRFANGFSDEVLEETTRRIAAWWNEVGANVTPVYKPEDFGFDPEAWVEGADEVLYRIAVAAALVFRLDADREGVIRAYRGLEQTGVLTDLYNGTVPEDLPASVDARALMLASLAARRCAESPDLAPTLEQQQTAGDAFTALDASLGRGLFRIELFWILRMLGQLGVIRYDDLGELTALPHRLVRDTLFRLGFVSTPYATDPAGLVAAARAARRAAGAEPADEILARFALAAGCAYDCSHRKACDFPCRERLE
ncbi:MAG TPA: hypothetical protein VHE35_21795 [Kofleriaceae bacterium]|nr:hypothetical protein [Kofleriaceae bacterium]